MLKDFKDIIFSKKECERCGGKEGVRRVQVSSFSGMRHYEYLCLKCALLEKGKVY